MNSQLCTIAFFVLVLQLLAYYCGYISGKKSAKKEIDELKRDNENLSMKNFIYEEKIRELKKQ